MKKQILGFVLIALSSIYANAAPKVVGDVSFNNHVVLMDKRIACRAESVSSSDLSSVVYADYKSISQEGNSFQLMGTLNGDFLGISGTVGGKIMIYVMEESTEGKPSYKFISGGRFTPGSPDDARLSVLFNGRMIEISCFLLR